MKRLKLAFLLCCITPAADAATYYVSKSGSDANSGSQTAPWLTISHAISAATSGDTIHVGSGDYSAASLHLSKSGLTILGATNSLLRGVYFEANNVTLSGFHIGDNNGDGWLDGAICRSLAGSDGSVLENSIVYSKVGKNQVGMNMAGTNFTCRNVEFTNNFTGAQIVQMSGASNQFLNCFVHDNASPEAVFYIWGYYNRIAGCVVSNNFEAELSGAHPDLVQSFFGTSWGHVIESNLFVNNSCQIGSLQAVDGYTPGAAYHTDAGGWIFRNNVFINSGSKLDVDFRDMQFLNNTFYNCNNATSEGYVINFNWSIFGCGTNGVMKNNLFAICGSNPASTNYGWFSTSEGTNTDNLIKNSMVVSNNMVVGSAYAAKNASSLIGSNWVNGGNPKFLSAPSSRIHKLGLTGTTDANATTNVNGTGTSFTTELAVGDRIKLGPYWTNNEAMVVAINSDTNLWTDVPIGTGVSTKYGGPQAIQRSQNYDPMPDLRLLAGSLAIDAGATLTNNALDFAGVERPAGAQYDIGAYEGATAEVVPTNMVLHITFNNWGGGTNALDSTTNHANAVVFNAGNPPTATNGPDGGSAAHIGNEQYFGITNSAALKDLAQGTVAVWAKRELTSGYSYILDCGFTYPSTNGWTLGNDNGLPTKLYAVGPDSSRNAVLTFSDYQNTDWHHYAFTWVGATCVGYFDGAPFQTNTLPSSVLSLNGANWLAVGAIQHNGTPQWGDDAYPNAAWLNGSVTDIRMYNTALSASDILNVYYVSASPELPHPPAGPVPGSLPPQLLMHLTFEGWNGATNVLDQTTNHCNAIAVGGNGPTLVAGPFGTNNAAHFASGQWLAVTNTVPLEYLTNGTVATWINYDNSVGSGDYYAIDGWYAYPDTNCFSLRAANGNPTAFRQILNTSSSTSANFPDWSDQSEWHHYGVTWDGTNVITYFDGNAVATNAQSAPFYHAESTAGWLAMGVQHGSHTYGSPTFGWLNGSLADVRIYNYTLAAPDITRLARYQEPQPFSFESRPPPLTLRIVAFQ